MTQEQFLDKIHILLSKYKFKYNNHSDDKDIQINYSLYANNDYPMGSLTISGSTNNSLLRFSYSTASLMVYPHGNKSFPVEMIEYKVYKYAEFNYNALDIWAKHQLDLLNLYNKTWKECLIKSKLNQMNNDFE